LSLVSLAEEIACHITNLGVPGLVVAVATLMDRPEMGYFNRITTTTRLGHQEEKQTKAETERKNTAPKVISSVVSLLLNEVPGYLSVHRRRLIALPSQPSTE
jgi:hypothetical protein